MSHSSTKKRAGFDKRNRELLRAYRAQDWPTVAHLFKSEFDRLCKTSVDWCMAENGQLESIDVGARSTSVVSYFYDCIARDLDDIISDFREPTVVSDIWHGSESSTRTIVLSHRFGAASLEIDYPEYSDDESDGSGFFRIILCHSEDTAGVVADLSQKALYSAGATIGRNVPIHLQRSWTDGLCNALGCDLTGLLLLHDSVLRRLTQRLDEELRRITPGTEKLTGQATLLHGRLSSSTRRRIARELEALAQLAGHTGITVDDYTMICEAFQRYDAFSRCLSIGKSGEARHGN